MSYAVRNELDSTYVTKSARDLFALDKTMMNASSMMRRGIKMATVGLLLSCVWLLGQARSPELEAFGASAASPHGMVWVPAGEFTMGWDGPEGRYDERPAHRVRVDGFWIDVTEVTNAQFSEFIEAAGYVTTAERKPKWEDLKKQVPSGTPKPPDDVLVAGSMVFVGTTHHVGLRNHAQWWRWTHGANWRQPKGPGSSIDGKDDHPVVHVSWDDAVAYCNWAGKRLPTEAEWERAARFGHDNARFAWGNELSPGGKLMANIWQGDFPYRNSKEDGFSGTAPVRSFPANELGLFDMAGNVWEWTSDHFRPDTYQKRTAKSAGGCCANPKGPATSADPRNPYAPVSRVNKGGSFLCHASYCESYRPSAKTGTPPDTGMSHLGFRCVKSVDVKKRTRPQRIP